MKEQEVVLRDFTTVEQSKILSEFLPIKTANMVYCYTKEGDKLISPIPIHLTSTPTNTFKYLHCWSLGALLDVIPKEVKIKGQRYAPCLFPIIDGHWLYKLWYNSNEIIESPIAVWHDNPVDARYEMILKLHKQKLL